MIIGLYDQIWPGVKQQLQHLYARSEVQNYVNFKGFLISKPDNTEHNTDYKHVYRLKRWKCQDFKLHEQL